ncbi:MAG: class II fructose-bisphosphatase [Planctomycetota bacterium]
MDVDLTSHLLRVAQAAAIEAARTTGYGERRHADHVATEAMRKAFDSVPMRGRVVIGEGERDDAPMLYIGEEVGTNAADAPEIDIAVDPLEGTNLCATGSPNASVVIATAERGGLLHAPDVYLDKIAVGPGARGSIDLNASTAENLARIAESLDREVTDLQIVVLDRERHTELIAEIRAAGARIQLITDGDLAPALAAALRGTGIHAVMGAGGAPEGVLTAAALRCLGGEIQGRLMPAKPGDEDRIRAAGIDDLDRVYRTEDLAPGKNIVFTITGVTESNLLRGVRFFGDGCRTHSLVLTSRGPRMVRFVDEIHISDDYRGTLLL